MPVVSVIMVAHRDNPYLREAVASVFAQTFQDFEFVFVDNGAGFAADAFGAHGLDPRFRWVRLPQNLGIPGGHNAGVGAATAEYIALMDYDDVSEPRRLESELAALAYSPAEVALVSGQAERINESSVPLGRREFSLTRPRDIAAYSLFAAPLVTPASMGRADIFRRFPYRPQFPFAADLDFQARVAEHYQMVAIPGVMLRYRWYSSQTTQIRCDAIERSRCVIQLLAARRRADRPELLEETVKLVGDAPAGESWRRGSARAFTEGLFVVGAYQARRSFATERSAASFFRALALMARGLLRMTAGDWGPSVSMFLCGPVKALKLQPAGE